MPLLLAQNNTQHLSGLPRDQSVNTFWFLVPVVDATTANLVAERVRDFYVAVAAGNPTPLFDWYGSQVAVGGHSVKIYEIDINTGDNRNGADGAPIHVEAYEHTGRAVIGDGGLASEVSMCLSFRNTTTINTPAARRRGRIYFGPLRAGAVDQSVDFNTPRPPAALQDEIRRAGVALRTANSAAAVWSIYSRPHPGRPLTPRPGKADLPAIPARVGSVHSVDQVWTDNAYDTQRRRGERPTGRTFA